MPDFGAAVLEPALAALGAELEEGDEADEETVHGVCEVLASLGVKDERIFEALCWVFERDQQFAAGMLASYGDSRALPMIERAIAIFEPDFSGMWGRSEVVELADAHERLGGVLPPELRERVDGWLAAWDAIQQRSNRSALSPQRKVGRNDPCRCGSGKKFKKCCLAADEAARPRVVDHRGDPLASRGPAHQMADFAQPLIDATDASLDAVKSALHISMLFWNLAITRDEGERQDALVDMALRLDEADRPEFIRTARTMVERHRAMFPELHGAG
jgi:hypothetical protein